MLAFTAARLLTPLTPSTGLSCSLMLTRAAWSRSSPPSSHTRLYRRFAGSDFGDAVIAPGYLDLHIHGNAGYDVSGRSSRSAPHD